MSEINEFSSTAKIFSMYEDKIKNLTEQLEECSSECSGNHYKELVEALEKIEKLKYPYTALTQHQRIAKEALDKIKKSL